MPFLIKYFYCIWQSMYIATVVLRPNRKPNCILLMSAWERTCSKTFIKWSRSLRPPQFPPSATLLFPLQQFIKKEPFQSSEMFSSCMICFTKSVIAVTIALSLANIFSTLTPDGPPAFSCFFVMASVTKTSVTNIAGPSTATVLFIEFLPHGNSIFKTLWQWSFQVRNFTSSAKLSPGAHFSAITVLFLWLLKSFWKSYLGHFMYWCLDIFLTWFRMVYGTACSSFWRFCIFPSLFLASTASIYNVSL